MIRFVEPLPAKELTQTSLAVGSDLDDALVLFGPQQDCFGCTTAVAAPNWTTVDVVERARRIFSPLSKKGPLVRPGSSATGLFRRGYWSEVDVDARAQRLHSVRMPCALVDAQRLLTINDLRGFPEIRPPIAIGLWALFSHPLVRMGARFGGVADGLTAEIALAVHSDRYVLIDSDQKHALTYVLTSPDIVATELIVLALRNVRAPFRDIGPWEDPLVQATTDLGLGVRSAGAVNIDAFVSPTLSSTQRNAASAMLAHAAELIGVRVGP